MKTRINQILLFTLFAFFLLAGNVKAEGTELHIASSLENSNNLKLLLWECYLGEAIENNLEIEAWMINENYWLNSDNYDAQYEESMNLEDWMINDSFFKNETINVNEGTETELEIESWMIDANLWDLD